MTADALRALNQSGWKICADQVGGSGVCRCASKRFDLLVGNFAFRWRILRVSLRSSDFAAHRGIAFLLPDQSSTQPRNFVSPRSPDRPPFRARA
jgi:hypothetical protein